MKVLVFILVLAGMTVCEGVEYSLRTTYAEAITGRSCTNDEMEIIWGSGERRDVRSRDLCNMSYYCRTRLCQGWPLNQCYIRYSQCRCRRELDEQDDRQLQQSYCVTEQASIEARHSSVYNSLSSSCKALVATRKHECYTVQQDQNPSSNQIIKFMLWNANTDEIMDYNLVDQDSFCEDSFEFSIEAVAGIQVDKAKFELYGPNMYNYQHTEFNSPFTMFANSYGNLMNGAKYPAGDYELMATPDDDPSRARTLRFYIKDSAHPDCVNYVPPPSPICNSASYLQECTRDSDCPTKYPSMGADDCSRERGNVCYCGSQICGCWQ